MIVLKNSQVLNNILRGEVNISNITFTSQQDIIEEVMEAEREHALSLKGLSDEEYNVAEKHSRLYSELLERKFIKVQKYTDGTELYSLNLISPNYAKILNEEGYFAINDTIYQITSDQVKVWVKGDINNYSFLNTIDETNASNNVYVFESNKNQNPITKSIPVIKKNDQKFAYCDYNSLQTRRVVISFYDETTLNIAQQGYNRNVFLRFSNQEKLDGKNFVFTDGPCALELGLRFVDDIPLMVFNTNVTGADVWYTIYFKYEFLNPGKDTQLITTAEDYYPIDNIFCNMTSAYKLAGGDGHQEDPNNYIYIIFEGQRDGGVFRYHSNTGAQFFTPMLPE